MFIMVLVVVMRDVVTDVALVIVTVTLVEGVTTATVVFGSTVDVIIDISIAILSARTVSAINASATVVFVSAVTERGRRNSAEDARLDRRRRRDASRRQLILAGGLTSGSSP